MYGWQKIGVFFGSNLPTLAYGKLLVLFLEADVTYKINMQVTNVWVTCLHYPYITCVYGAFEKYK